MTICEALEKGREILENNNIDEAKLNAELFLSDILNCKRLDLYSEINNVLSQENLEKYFFYIERRIKNEPLQYILGKAWFYGYEFYVNEYVLVPRPETEILVEKILEDIYSSNFKSLKIFEIGSGSGCISIAIAKELEKRKIIYNISSIEVSSKAIEIADKNKELNNIKGELSFIHSDLFVIENLDEKFDYIISNPPYISIDEFEKLDKEVKNFEPGISLTDFGDGLKFYKKIFELISYYKFNSKIFLEIAYNRKEQIQELLKEFKLKKYNFYKDYSSNFRILKIET